jgi:GT2 family glycosyltransferase
MNKTCFEIAVLIACHNRREKTLRCLRDLFNQQHIDEKFNFTVFLVDDASTDGTSEAISKNFPQVRIIRGTGYLYWNKGMHLAWKKALEEKEFDFYLWLNDDSVLFQDAIFTMLETFHKCGEDSIICGSTKSELTGIFTYGLRIKKGIELVPNGEIQFGEFMNGNVVLISKKIYEAIGIIDNIFPHAIGDNDYGLRAVKNGIRIATPADYIGYCEGHDKLPAWCLPEVPFKKRLKSLYSPLGNSHPRYFFIFVYRHFGLAQAIKHFMSIHLRVLIPSLWK